MGIQVILGICHPSVITFVNHQAHFLLVTAAFTFMVEVTIENHAQLNFKKT